jgi:4-hydroxybenzoate polyprenyltransferase
LQSLRPKQWLKNLFVMAPLVFSKHLFEPASLWAAAWAFIIFCLLSGASYLCNDLFDIECDRRHHSKCSRPLAAGTLSLPLAGATAVLFMLTGLALAGSLGSRFFTIALGFMVLQLAYSIYLKDLVLIDVGTIAAGFIIRVAAGAEAVGVEISAWLFSCTVLLALFLGLTKRRRELQLGDTELATRKVLREYNPTMLDMMIATVGSATVISYALYTRDPETIARAGTTELPYTFPFVLYGLLRYLFLVYRTDDECRKEGPDQFLTDRPLLLNLAAWALTVVALLYRSGPSFNG